MADANGIGTVVEAIRGRYGVGMAAANGIGAAVEAIGGAYALGMAGAAIGAGGVCVGAACGIGWVVVDLAADSGLCPPTSIFASTSSVPAMEYAMLTTKVKRGATSQES